MNAFRTPRPHALTSTLPADERRPLPLEAEFEGVRRPETHAASPNDPDRYLEIFCAGTD